MYQGCGGFDAGRPHTYSSVVASVELNPSVLEETHPRFCPCELLEMRRLVWVSCIVRVYALSCWDMTCVCVREAAEQRINSSMLCVLACTRHEHEVARLKVQEAFKFTLV